MNDQNYKYSNIKELNPKHKSYTEEYEYIRKDFVERGYANYTLVAVYEIPPLKSAFPYHYHHKNEETFFILSGEGILRCHDGERKVKAGDLFFFPANEKGVHKLMNTSETENLIYLDFDVIHDLDVAIYPDSNKIGVWGKDINKVYELDKDVNYYKGE